MPIVMVPSAPGNIIGPGIGVGVRSDFIGPLPTGSFFRFVANSDIEFTKPVVTQQFEALGPTTDFRMYSTKERAGSTFFFVISNDTLPTGSTAYCQTDLFQGGTTLVDTGRDSFTWDATAGVANLVALGEGQGGLTPAQDQTLTDIQNAVNAALRTATGLVLETPIGSILAHPARQLLNFDTGPGRLTGRGSLNPKNIPGVGTICYGLMLTSAIVPPGFGLRDGQIQEYFERIGQFVTLFPTNSGAVNYPAEVFDYFLTSFCWLWRDPFPGVVLYDISPGCAVDAFWVVA